MNIDNYKVNFGPQHPSAHGVMRLVLDLDGEVIKKVDAHAGLLHRSIEKLCENNLYNQLTDVQYIFHFLHCCSFLLLPFEADDFQFF